MLPSDIRRILVTECCKEDVRYEVNIENFVDRFMEEHEADEVRRAFDYDETTKSDKLFECLLSHPPTDLIETGMFTFICMTCSAEVVQEILKCLQTHMLTSKISLVTEDGDQGNSTAENNHNQTHLTDADYSEWPLLMPSKRGQTALHYACASGKSAV